MSETRFDVYFSGQLAPGVDAGQAAMQLARSFKTQPDRLAPLFTGKPALVKRNLSRAEAVRYRQALSQAGMTSIFREHGAPPPPTANREPGREPNREPGGIASPQQDQGTAALTTAAPAVVSAVVDASPVAPRHTAAFTLAPTGSDVLAPEERRQITPVEVDISSLSLAPAGAELLRPEERRKPPAIDVDTSALQVVAIPPADALRP